MAGSPRWKVYDSDGVYQASCKDTEAAALIVSFYGTGSTIRDGHSTVVWTEGVTHDGYADASYTEVDITIGLRTEGK